MIRICLMHSTAEPTSSITAWIVHHIDSTFPNHSISFSRTSKTVQLHLHNMTVMTTMMGHDNTLGKVENTFLYFFFTFFHFFVKKVEKLKKRKVLYLLNYFFNQSPKVHALLQVKSLQQVLKSKKSIIQVKKSIVQVAHLSCIKWPKTYFFNLWQVKKVKKVFSTFPDVTTTVAVTTTTQPPWLQQLNNNNNNHHTTRLDVTSQSKGRYTLIQ